MAFSYIKLLLIGKESKRHYVLMKDFNIFMDYVVEENIFVVIVYSFLVEQKHQNFMSVMTLQLMVNK